MSVTLFWPIAMIAIGIWAFGWGVLHYGEAPIQPWLRPWGASLQYNRLVGGAILVVLGVWVLYRQSRRHS
jgi:hypothetical protein